MDFLKRIFGTGGGVAPRGQYYYVRPTGCTEIVRVRVDAMNELSLNDDSSGYFVRKNARGTSYKCTRSAELVLTFDSQKRLQNTEVTGGTLVTQAEYEAWLDKEEEES